MTELLRKNRRTGILSIVAALVVVLVFWALVVPRTARYKGYTQEGRIKARLEDVRPPDEARLVSMRATPLHEPNLPNVMAATATYVADSDCGVVEAHYKQEFPKHGFVYQDKKQETKENSRILSFSATDYDATLSCTKTQAPPQIYVIIIWSHAHD